MWEAYCSMNYMIKKCPFIIFKLSNEPHQNVTVYDTSASSYETVLCWFKCLPSNSFTIIDYRMEVYWCKDDLCSLTQKLKDGHGPLEGRKETIILPLLCSK